MTTIETVGPTNHAITTTVNVDPKALQQSIDNAKAEMQTLLLIEQRGGIQSQAVASVIAESIRDWARQWDALEKKRTEITKPINQSKRLVDDLFKPGLTELEGLRAFASKLLGAWEVLQAKVKREALSIATEAIQQQAMPELTAALNIANTPSEKTAGVTVKARWIARVLDVNMLPMRFQKCIADEEKIAAYVSKFEPHQVPDPVKGLVFELIGGVTQVRR